METSPLIPFWILPKREGFPHHGFGVTAFSLHDAVRIINELGYAREVPEDPGELTITENVRVSDLDQNHIVPNIGPIAVRGMWYPLQQVGR